MYFKNIFSFIAVILITVYFLTSCENSTQPEEIKPGRRDYVWEVDSIDVPYFFLTDISGTSPNDVWAVGPGGDLDKTIWHYDGKKWSTDGISRNVSPVAVFAIDDVVWIAGSGGVIWKREHGSWAFSAKLELDGYKYIGFNNLWGDNKNSIYAVGVAVAENEHIYRQSIIAYYDGNNWELLNTGEIKCSFTSIKKDPMTKEIYIAGMRNEPFVPDTSKLFLLKKGKLIKVNWVKHNPWDDIFIQTTKHELLFGMGWEIKYLTNNKFIPLVNLNGTNYSGGFAGRNIKDIFVGMRDGIMHYNGSNFKYIYHFPHNMEVRLGRIAVFTKEYFQIESSHNYILHGKLK